MTDLSRPWLVYLLRCADDSYYCGATNDLERRIEAHNNGNGARYTRGRGPVEVIALREGLTHPEALRLERQVKKVSRKRKIQVLRSAILA